MMFIGAERRFQGTIVPGTNGTIKSRNTHNPKGWALLLESDRSLAGTNIYLCNEQNGSKNFRKVGTRPVLLLQNKSHREVRNINANYSRLFNILTLDLIPYSRWGYQSSYYRPAWSRGNKDLYHVVLESQGLQNTSLTNIFTTV